MPSNLVKKCAAGAMLFGGTLGATSAANAGLVVWNCNIAVTSTVNGSYNYGTFANVETQQFYSDTYDGPVGAPVTNWDLRFAPNDSTRFRVGCYDPSVGLVTNTNGTGLANLASGAVVGSSLVSPLGYAVSSSLLVNAGNPNAWSAGATGYFGFQFKVASGAIRYGWGEIALLSGSLKQATVTRLVYDDTGASVTVGVVPAPGAFALVGLAGMITGRRRKA
jgi:hypothetical protein